MNNPASQSDQSVSYRGLVSFCLLALLPSFVSLSPGEPVEKPDFSHMSATAFWSVAPC
jgi:hypothetical protein